jgi:transposase
LIGLTPAASGSLKPTAFYDYVRKLRQARQASGRQMAVRFEGLPGEFVQIDWGEIRKLKFTAVGAEPQTWYFFCARLKYSRFMFVSFQKNMVEETLVRCLIASFNCFGGVPWCWPHQTGMGWNGC